MIHEGFELAENDEYFAQQREEEDRVTRYGKDRLPDSFFTERVHFPAAFSISPAPGDEDYSLCAQDFAVAVKFTYRINGVFPGPNGRSTLSGWSEAAASTATVFVRGVKNREAALKAVRLMAQQISLATLKLFPEIPAHLRPIITGIPLGFRIVGKPQIVERKKPRALGYVSDIIDGCADLLRRKISTFNSTK